MWLCVVVCGGRAWSCVRGPSCVVVRGSAWSSLTAVLPASRPALSCCRDARKDGHTRGRTTYNTPLNPPGVGWVNFCYPINVIVSIRTCVPNLGSIRGSVRKNCLLSLIIDVTRVCGSVGRLNPTTVVNDENSHFETLPQWRTPQTVLAGQRVVSVTPQT